MKGEWYGWLLLLWILYLSYNLINIDGPYERMFGRSV